jgi:hypothetical protein
MPFLKFTDAHREDWMKWRAQRLAPTADRVDPGAQLFLDLPTPWALPPAGGEEKQDDQAVRASQYGELPGVMTAELLAAHDSGEEEIDDLVLATDISVTKADQAQQHLDLHVHAQWTALMKRRTATPLDLPYNAWVVFRHDTTQDTIPNGLKQAAWDMPVWVGRVTSAWTHSSDASLEDNKVSVQYYYQSSGDINKPWTKGIAKNAENTPWVGVLHRLSVLHSDGIEVKDKKLQPKAKSLHISQYWEGPYVLKKRGRNGTLVPRETWKGWADWDLKLGARLQVLGDA